MEKVRKLSDTFMDNLLEGHLKQVLEAVKADMDLDLQIRSNYINIYYKGNSLLKLSEVDPGRYKAESHEKFTGRVPIPDLTDEVSTANFIARIPSLKENITEHGRSSLELEYEQLVILIDYNPRSKFFERARLHELPFTGQVKIFRTGFGVWQTNLDIPVRV